MKTRIVETLSALSAGDCGTGNPYMSKLLEIFAPASSADISGAARRALMQLLFDFGSFNVSTIDSFFQTVLRTFARELNLPDNYRIQLNQREAIDSAVHDMLDVINSNSPYFPDSRDAASIGRKARLREWILAYMESMMTDGKAFNLFNRATSTFAGLAERLSLLFNETYKLHADEIDGWFDADSGTRVIRLREALGKRLALLRKDLVQRTGALLSEVAMLGDKVISRNLMTAMTSWSMGKLSTGKTPESAAIGEPKACVYKPYYGNTALIDRIAGVCRANLDDQRQIACVDFLLHNLFPLGLFGEMRRHLEKFCRDENMVLQSNTNDFLSRIIASEEEAPFIYERLGLRLRHFLLDEFQDTSMMQWNILRPLILESLSHDKDNLIIGDGKQSIYGFRNTDFRLLNHIVADEIQKRGYTVDLRGSGKGENVNYRSAHCIVKFNNALFDALPSVYNLRPSDTSVSVYADTVQELAGRTDGVPGYVDIAFHNKESDSADMPDFVEVAMSRMLDGVIRQLRAGYRPRDIAILVRKRREGEMAVKYLLNAMDTPVWEGLPRVQVMSSDALLVGESPLVKMLVARLRMLMTPSVGSPDAADSQSRWPSVGQRDLTHLANRFHMHLFASGAGPAGALSLAVEECSPRMRSRQADDDADTRLLTSPASGLITMAERIVREAMEEMKGKGIPVSDTEVHNIYLTGFMDLVNEYVSHYGNDLRGFLEWWDMKRLTQSLTIPGDVDAINVLTIHKAKGLEFPCVHVPFLDFRMTETSTPFKRSYSWYKTDSIPGIDPDLVPPYIPLENSPALAGFPGAFAQGFSDFVNSQYLDNINLLYVALTRPTRELVVTALVGGRDETVGDALLKGAGAATEETPLKFNLAGMLDSSGTLTIGEPTVPLCDTGEPQSSFMPPYITRDNDNILEITGIDDRYIRDFSDPAQRLIFLKRVLGSVRRVCDISVVVRRMAHKARLDKAYSTQAFNTISNAIASTPEASGWFDSNGRIMLCPELFAGNVSIIRRWRPDRIVWRPDGYIDVVEYCTADTTEAHLAVLRGKVRSCMRQLAAMGHNGIRGFIWDLDASVVHRLSVMASQ
jgi:superfamily I DNA/RNA helicase